MDFSLLYTHFNAHAPVSPNKGSTAAHVPCSAVSAHGPTTLRGPDPEILTILAAAVDRRRCAVCIPCVVV